MENAEVIKEICNTIEFIALCVLLGFELWKLNG